jgi:membrane protein YdbS with pleckstrin-like domain
MKIPLDKITDFRWFQGPIMRLCGISSISIKTASSSDQTSEAVLIGIKDALSTRDALVQMAKNITIE